MGTLVAPNPVQATTSHAGFQRVGDTALQDYVNGWLAARRDTGFIGEAVVRNMALVGVTPEDFPANVQI